MKQHLGRLIVIFAIIFFFDWQVYAQVAQPPCLDIHPENISILDIPNCIYLGNYENGAPPDTLEKWSQAVDCDIQVFEDSAKVRHYIIGTFWGTNGAFKMSAYLHSKGIPNFIPLMYSPPNSILVAWDYWQDLGKRIE
jgi:hypothetical protein